MLIAKRYGHYDSVMSLDSMSRETVLSSGGFDRTVRFWNIAKETQLVFGGELQTRSSSKNNKLSLTYI